MKHKPFLEEKKQEIQDYCEKNFISFKKLFACVHGCNNELGYFQYLDREKLKTIDPETVTIGSGEIPPCVLWVYNEPDGLRFEQTEHTKRYLSI